MQVVATDYVQNYVRHISDGSPPKAEYMRHFEATSPRALRGCDVLTTGPGARFAEIEARRSTKIEGSLPFVDLEVKHTVDNMVESLVFAGQPMDSLSIDDLGLEVHHVPGDGDCLVHSWVKVLATKINDDFPIVFRSVGCCREAIARFFAEHRHLLELHHQKKRVWPWHRPEDDWINCDSPPTSVDEYITFLRTPGTWLTNYELQALVTMSPPSLKCFTRNQERGLWQQIPRFTTNEYLRGTPSRETLNRGDVSLSHDVCLQFSCGHYNALLESTSSTRHALYARASLYQDKQAVLIKKRSVATLNPVSLTVGTFSGHYIWNIYM